MTTFLQLHLLTAYPPANLNRDDSGSPKTAIFGCVPRLRVSSQSLKRAWRTSDLFRDRVGGRVGSRTQRIGAETEKSLLAAGVAPERARDAARKVADVFGKVKPEKDANPTFTEQLAFVSPEERQAAIDVARAIAEGDRDGVSAADILRKSDGAADIAMFGRMLADDPAFNREAAVQVAHAISTHRVTLEDDYYVAVDDLKGKTDREDAGTSFIGVQEFAAGLFYLYICVDIDLLVANLGGDRDIARDAIAALVEAAAVVAPKGKQASFASRAYASFMMAECGDAQPRTLAAAFLKPVAPSEEDGDAALASARRLRAFRQRLVAAYGDDPAHVEMDATDETASGSLSAVIAFATSDWP